jgi:hypothetical protein
MSGSQKLLICSGLALLILTMGYGLGYAVFAEHQRLDQIGSSLAATFATAATGDMPSSDRELDAYGRAKYLYVREVDAHSHWGGLAILLLLFGVVFNRVGFAERIRLWLAVALTSSSFAFPLSVLLENFNRGEWPRMAATVTSAILIVSMITIATGFARYR